MSLKDLTWEHHKNAERQEFVKVLMSGAMSPDAYATFLYNQHPCYNLLEVIAMTHGLLDDIPEVRRAPQIFVDYEELWEDKETPPRLLAVTKEYTDHIMSIKDDKEKIMAHLYVRHMGDLSGGQMIRKKVPGKGTMFDFDGDINVLKEKIRAKIHDGLADEAKLCFDFATKAFKEMTSNVDSICIVGGGTAGWMTAAYALHNLPNISITLVESPNIPTVGVGEATILGFDHFLKDCGIPVALWSKACDATIKCGTYFPDW